MPIVADASAAVRADLRPFERDLKKLDRPIATTGQKLSAALSPKSLALGVAGGFLGAQAITEVTSFLKDSVMAASDLNETISKTGQIFGEEALPGLEKWAEGAAEAFGQSERQALDAASTFAIFGKSAGLAGDDLIGFSKELTELSADFASFFNTSPEDAITAIGAALRGESEPIRRYGILLDEATLRQRALTMGIIDNIKTALTPQQRVLAAQAEILAQSADAQGDFARTSEGTANQMRILEARVENLQAGIGEALLPVLANLLQMANDLVTGLGELGGVVDGLNAPFEAVQEAIGTTQEKFEDFGISIDPGDWARSIHNFVDDTARDLLDLQPAIRDTGAEATTMSEEWAEAWQKSTQATEDGADAVTDATAQGMEDAAGAVDEGAEVIVGKFGEIPGDGADAMLDEQWRLKDAATQLTNFMDQALSPMEEKAQIRGFLTSKKLANALTSNNPLIRQKAREMRDAATDRLDELTSKGYNAGRALAEALAEGMRAGAPTARAAVGYLVGQVSGFLPRSEPKDPRSPLRGITTIGGGIVDMIADDMLSNIRTGERAAAALAAAVNPSLAPVGTTIGAPGGPAATLPLRGGNNYDVKIQAPLREQSTLEVSAEMRRAEYLGLMPGSDQ